AEFFFLPKLFEVLQTLDEQINGWPFESLLFTAAFLQFFGQFSHELWHAAGPRTLDGKRNALNDAVEKLGLGRIGRNGFKQDNARAAVVMLCGQRNQRDAENSERIFFVLTHDHEVAGALALENGFGRTFDGVWRAYPNARSLTPHPIRWGEGSLCKAR